MSDNLDRIMRDLERLLDELDPNSLIFIVDSMAAGAERSVPVPAPVNWMRDGF